jgi:phosphoribosyl 1,2-cyclic phosphodiesterase
VAEIGEFIVRFWGVRGTIATPGRANMRYGGNTSCIEMRCGPNLLIFDGGTGLRELGKSLESQGRIEADLFFSHTHIDHIAGLPFFRPLFNKGNRVKLWAGHLLPGRTLNEVLCRIMSAPLFPVPFEVLSADVATHDFRHGDNLAPHPGIVIRTIPLNHPDGATGYRIEYAGKSVCYVTDTEHVAGHFDDSILRLIKDADLFIYDCTYTDAEYAHYAGWGHSTWEEGARLAEAAGVKTFVIFHHDPDHDDRFMDRVAADAQHRRAGTIVAKEGLVLRP